MVDAWTDRYSTWRHEIEVKAAAGQDVELELDEISEATVGRFDVVLFLGVIYHLRHPLLALDRIHDICAPEATLLVETHMIDEGLVDGEGKVVQRWAGETTPEQLDERIGKLASG